MSGFSACRTGHLGYHFHHGRSGGARLYRALGNSTLTLPHVITTVVRGGRAPRNVHVPGYLIPCYNFRLLSRGPFWLGASTGLAGEGVGGVVSGARFSRGMFGFRVRTPLVTGTHGTNRFIVIHIKRGNRHVPLAVTKTSATGNAVALIMRGIKLSSVGLYGLGRKSCVASIMNPLKGTARVSGFNAIIYTKNNINMTPVLPVVRTLGTTNGHIVSILTKHDGRLVVLRSRMHGDSSRIVVVASSKDCKHGNLIARNVRDIVRQRAIGGYFTVNPTIVVGFYYLLAGGCRVPASISLGAVVISNANVYNTYHVAINKGAHFMYISNPRFSNRRISFSRVLGHVKTFGGRRMRRLRHFGRNNGRYARTRYRTRGSIATTGTSGVSAAAPLDVLASHGTR